jgi:hypothetical protein
VNINLLVESVTQSWSLDGEGMGSFLTLMCSRTERDGILEIGTKHAFAHKNEHVERCLTRFGEMRLDIRRKSALKEERVVRLGLNEEKIGEVGFYPPHDKTDDLPSFPATLEVFVFVSDHAFESILRSVTHGAQGMTASVYLPKHPAMAYGWEPDGSRMVWTIEKPSEPAYVPVGELKIELPLYNGTHQ